jgi:hypothetical protein
VLKAVLFPSVNKNSIASGMMKNEGKLLADTAKNNKEL